MMTETGPDDVRHSTEHRPHHLRGLRLIAGAVVGAVVGAIGAVNIVIFAGIDDGYEASPAEVFEQSPLVGILAVSALALGVGAGVNVARRS